MPITSTQTISAEIDSIKFSFDGSLDIVIRKVANGDASSATTQTFHLEEVEADTILDVIAEGGHTPRELIVYAVYSYLITKGLVEGSITL